MSIDLNTIAAIVTILLGIASFIGSVFHQIRQFFSWLEGILPAKLLLLAYGFAFALCAFLQIKGLDTWQSVPDIHFGFQNLALIWFGSALLLCALAALVTLGDGVIKYRNRTRYYFVKYFDPFNPRGQ